MRPAAGTIADVEARGRRPSLPARRYTFRGPSAFAREAVNKPHGARRTKKTKMSDDAAAAAAASDPSAEPAAAAA